MWGSRLAWFLTATRGNEERGRLRNERQARIQRIRDYRLGHAHINKHRIARTSDAVLGPCRLEIDFVERGQGVCGFGAAVIQGNSRKRGCLDGPDIYVVKLLEMHPVIYP